MPEADGPLTEDLYRSDRDLIEQAAREAGKIACRYFKQDPQQWMKEGHSPVSEADLAVDAFLRQELIAGRPDYGWLSEETDDNAERLSQSRVFIVDPIDGTRSFLAGKSEWTISIAVVEDGRPIAAAVFCPDRAEMFLASAGAGAEMNGVPLQVSGRGKTKGALLNAPKSLMRLPGIANAGFRQAEFISPLAYRLSMVAAGKREAAAVSAAARDWDLAAADLLVQEAGGKVTDLAGRQVAYNKVETRHPVLVAGPEALVAPLRDLLRKPKS